MTLSFERAEYEKIIILASEFDKSEQIRRFKSLLQCNLVLLSFSTNHFVLNRPLEIDWLVICLYAFSLSLSLSLSQIATTNPTNASFWNFTRISDEEISNRDKYSSLF
jgi:hypothetical protein